MTILSHHVVIKFNEKVSNQSVVVKYVYVSLHRTSICGHKAG